MNILIDDKNEFRLVLNTIIQSNRHIYQEDKDVISLLSNNTIDDLIGQGGEIYYENKFKFHNSIGRKEFFKTLQLSNKYKYLFKSPLIQKAIEYVNHDHDLWFIGNSFSDTFGNYVIFEGDLSLPSLFKHLDFCDSLKPQIWRDIKVYREKGIIDLQYNEGILGTEVGQTNIVIEGHWDFNLKEQNGLFELEVVCDGIAVSIWKT